MGVDVLLLQISPLGTSPKRRRLTELDAVLDRADVFARICAASRLPMLGRVDPYGDLVLTAAEMPQLVGEVDVELGLAVGGPEREILAGVRRLAERCASDPSMELHLQGD